MRSTKTTMTAAAVLTAGFVLAAPAAHAATASAPASAPQVHPHSACGEAIHAAHKARADFEAADEDMKQQVDAEGHPGTAEEGNLADLKETARAAVEKAIHECAGEEHHRHHPHGAMHTGVGSMTQGVNGGEVAGGLGVLGAAGFGALALRRRRAGSEG